MRWVGVITVVCCMTVLVPQPEQDLIRELLLRDRDLQMRTLAASKHTSLAHVLAASQHSTAASPSDSDKD